MGFVDMVKGLLGGDVAQSALEATGLNEHVEGFLGEGTAVAESLGGEVDQAADTIGSVGDSLPGGAGEAVQGVAEGLPDTPSL